MTASYMPAIHQFLAGFSRADAISNEALVMRKLFRSWRCRSEIYCEQRRILPEFRNEAKDIIESRGDFKPDDIAFLHLSSGSLVNEVFGELPCKKIIRYHNITPPAYFRGIHEQIAHNLNKGREQIRMLAGKASLSLAASQFNAGELKDAGYSNVQVLPLLLDFEALQGKADRASLDRYDDGLANIVFVGRCAPNKRIEDLLFAFYYFQKYVEPNSRLLHVGSFYGFEKYYALLLSICHNLELKNVMFLGAARQPELNAVYRTADLFLCMSEHEGFCIPLMESMVFDVPAMAYAATAVPETLDGSGVLFREKQFDLIAEMMGRLIHDAPLRSAIIQGQRERLNRYRQRNLASELHALMAPMFDA